MSSNYYKSSITGDVIGEYSLYIADSIYGSGTVDKLISDGTLTACDAPSVIDYIHANNRFRAVVRYREIHGCGITEAKRKVDMMFEDAEKFSRMNRNVAV